MRYLHLAMLAATVATAFSQSATEESPSVNMARQLAGKVDAQVDYPLKAYICLDDSSEVKKPAALWLGSKLQQQIPGKECVRECVWMAAIHRRPLLLLIIIMDTVSWPKRWVRYPA